MEKASITKQSHSGRSFEVINTALILKKLMRRFINPLGIRQLLWKTWKKVKTRIRAFVKLAADPSKLITRVVPERVTGGYSTATFSRLLGLLTSSSKGGGRGWEVLEVKTLTVKKPLKNQSDLARPEWAAVREGVCWNLVKPDSISFLMR